MKNYEKYADEIRGLKSDIGIEWCESFAKPKILKLFGRKCESISCGLCNALTTLWLLEEYKEPEEPETDWSKVEVDTPILVRNSEDEVWIRRHFAKYENGEVYAWDNGYTRWTASDMAVWKYANLADGEEEKE